MNSLSSPGLLTLSGVIDVRGGTPRAVRFRHVDSVLGLPLGDVDGAVDVRVDLISAIRAVKLPIIASAGIGDATAPTGHARPARRDDLDREPCLAGLVCDLTLNLGKRPVVDGIFRRLSIVRKILEADERRGVLLGEVCNSPSGAAAAADGSIRGEDATNHNGWIWWKYQDETGEWVTLDSLREE